MYWPQAPDQAVIEEINEGNYQNAIKMLEYGACVSECPSDEGAVLCRQTVHMQSNPDSYDGCVYYPGGVSSGVAYRYPTKSFAGHFCLPDAEMLDSENLKTAMQ